MDNPSFEIMSNISKSSQTLYDQLELFKGPPSPERPCAPRLLFYESRVTRNCFWGGFLSKPYPLEPSCLKSSKSMQEFILQLWGCCFQELFCDWAGPSACFRSYLVQYVSCQIIPRSWRYCTVMPKKNIVNIRLRGACVIKQRNGWISCGGVVWIPDHVDLDAGPWQVSLFRLIWFDLRDINRTARECVIDEWFCRTVFVFFLCIFRRTIELN